MEPTIFTAKFAFGNTLEDAQGKKVKLKEGAEVDVTIEADPKDTAPKETSSK